MANKKKRFSDAQLQGMYERFTGARDHHHPDTGSLSWTLEQIAEFYGCSKSWVQQVVGDKREELTTDEDLNMEGIKAITKGVIKELKKRAKAGLDADSTERLSQTLASLVRTGKEIKKAVHEDLPVKEVLEAIEREEKKKMSDYKKSEEAKKQEEKGDE